MNGHTLEDILKSIRMEYELKGPIDRRILMVSEPHAAKPNHLIWISDKNNRAAEILSDTDASVVICSKDLVFDEYENEKTFIMVCDPRLAFSRVMQLFKKPAKQTGIHNSAHISEAANLSTSVMVGAFSFVGKCMVGDNTVIDHNVTLYDDVVIGRNCRIHSGTVLGVDGFGIAINQERKYEKIEHVGQLIIGDDVEIFSNVTIAKALLSHTKIGNGCKINNNCHIAHNVTIEENSVITANATICGSVRVGRNSWLGPNCTIRNGISIGCEVTIGMGAVITKDVPSNQTWVGNPGRPVT